jgi:hypothetical protein
MTRPLPLSAIDCQCSDSESATRLQPPSHHNILRNRGCRDGYWTYVSLGLSFRQLLTFDGSTAVLGSAESFSGVRWLTLDRSSAMKRWPKGQRSYILPKSNQLCAASSVSSTRPVTIRWATGASGSLWARGDHAGAAGSGSGPERTVYVMTAHQWKVVEWNPTGDRWIPALVARLCPDKIQLVGVTLNENGQF